MLTSQSLKFIHLHLHTYGSLLDGMEKPVEYVKIAKKYGMRGLAITDHGNLNRSLEFYKTCKENNLKPIIGCEFYLSQNLGKKNEEGKRLDRRKNHIILLVKNLTGWKNILRLNYLSFDENHFYYYPTISFEDIFKYKDGLILQTACLKSVWGDLILEDKFNEAEKLFLEVYNIFKDDFYVEIQINDLTERQKKINDKLIELANKYNVKIIATCDVHYINKDDYKYQEFLTAIKNKTTIENVRKEKLNFISSRTLYFQHPDDIFHLNEKYHYNYDKNFLNQIIENTMEVFEKVDFQMPFEKHYPAFIITEDIKNKYNIENENLEAKKNLLIKLSIEGLKKRINEGQIDKNKIEIYKNRLKKELEIIEKLNFIDYFLIVWDICKFAKENNIRRGVGRGSVGGSLLAYLLEITEIDPIRWSTLLERFIDVERPDPPDIDIDFDKDRRDEIFNYLAQKYKNIINIGTSQNFKVKSIVRDYARVYNFDKQQMEWIDKLCKDYIKNTDTPDDFDKIIETHPEFRENIKDIDKIAKTVRKLYGISRNLGSHASGVCVTDKPIWEIMPISKSENVLITGYTEGETRELTEIGVTKIDILGLKTVSIIDETLRNIEKNRGKEEKEKAEKMLYNFDNYINDTSLIKELLKDNVGIFMFESDDLWNFTKALKPENYKHLIDASALYRPDILKSGQAQLYLRRKNEGEMPPKEFLENEILKEITKDTQYTFVYQEQIMFLLNRFFGFTMAEANTARKYISKKRKPDFIKMLNEKIGTLLENNTFFKNKEYIKTLVENLYEFGGYSFNYSHSVAYTLTSLQCLYLRTYYKLEFYTALLNQNILDEEKTYRIFTSAKNNKIEILPVDINKSNWVFQIENDKIRAGFSLIKNFSYRAYQEIDRIRKENNGEIKSLADFFMSSPRWDYLNKNIMESMILVGVFDTIEPNRYKVLEIYKKFISQKDKIKKTTSNNLTLFENTKEFEGYLKTNLEIFNVEVEKEMDIDEKIKAEKKYFGFVFWTDIFLNHRDFIKNLIEKGIITNFSILEKNKFIFGYLEKQKKITGKNGKTFHILTFVDTANNKKELLCFDNLYQKIKPKTKGYYLIDLGFYIDKNNQERYNIKDLKIV